MTLEEFVQNKRNNKAQPMAFDKKNAIGKALSVQVHTKGIKPRYELNDVKYAPKGYDARYDDVFKHELLNQYPNEEDEMYNYRLSIYSPIQKEIASRFFTQITGTILNPNNYSISSDNEDFKIHLSRIEQSFDEKLKFILNNPTAFFAVIQINPMAGEDSKAVPDLICVDATSMIMYDKLSAAFKHNGKVYFMDVTQVVCLKENEKEHTYVQETRYVHNFPRMPFWMVQNEFMDQYVVWCNEITKSHSDSQIVDKNYSHPIKQVIEVECKKCTGRGRIADKAQPECENCEVDCDQCKGKGVLSMSPGQVYGIPEHIIRNMGSIPQIASFTTPDMGIPTYHGEKWERYYEKAENSLHLKKRGSASESGEAKREDRKDSYFYYQTISDTFFTKVIKPAMYFVGLYSNVVFRENTAIHEALMIDIKEPRQFDLMTDMDLIDENIAIAEKSDNPMLIAEMSNAMNQKLYSQNPELEKINSVLYQVDPLFGLSGNNEKSKMLSGIYSPQELWIHTMGYFALKEILLLNGSQKFITTSNAVLIDRLKTMAQEAIPEVTFDE